MADLPEYTLRDVEDHKSDNWTVIDGNVYDVTPYLDEHPGGVEALEEAAGRDSTEDFEDTGHSADAVQMLKQFLIGTLSSSADAEVDDPATEAESTEAARSSAAEGSVSLSSETRPLTTEEVEQSMQPAQPSPPTEEKHKATKEAAAQQQAKPSQTQEQMSATAKKPRHSVESFHLGQLIGGVAIAAAVLCGAVFLYKKYGKGSD